MTTHLQMISIDFRKQRQQLTGFDSSSGTLWQPVAPCGTLWHPVAACGTLWQPVAACGTQWQPLTPCGTLWHLSLLLEVPLLVVTASI